MQYIFVSPTTVESLSIRKQGSDHLIFVGWGRGIGEKMFASDVLKKNFQRFMKKSMHKFVLCEKKFASPKCRKKQFPSQVIFCHPPINISYGRSRSGVIEGWGLAKLRRKGWLDLAVIHLPLHSVTCAYLSFICQDTPLTRADGKVSSVNLDQGNIYTCKPDMLQVSLQH